jgi:predicted RNA binding protein YcfA (HicA-like mRNA interferase family)
MCNFRYLYTQKWRWMMVLTNSRDIIRRLEAEGWVLVSSKGSHHKFRRGGQSLIMPHPKKDLPLGTARSIAKVAGWLKET